MDLLTAMPSSFGRAAAIDASLGAIRPEAGAVPGSGIIDIANHGRGRPGLIPLWMGEGDLATPAVIADAAHGSLAAGETFYTHPEGIPELREAIARYIGRVHGRPVPPERFFVTASGMQGFQIAARIVAGSGDEVLVPTPAWPNVQAAIRISGARPVAVPMRDEPAGWTFDVDDLARAVTPATRAIAINSPANPTGWIATHGDLAAILALARRHGLWIVADEIYGRLVYTGSHPAPSFRDVMDPEDRVLFVQSFSKNWAMTGWRMGWLEAPPSLGPVISNLLEHATSGVAVFMQRAGIAALDHGEPFLALQIERSRLGRDLMSSALAATGRIRFAMPQAGFFLFFSVDGVTDTHALAFRLIETSNVGLAPGAAFGPGGERYLRLCFARQTDVMREAATRLFDGLIKLA